MKLNTSLYRKLLFEAVSQGADPAQAILSVGVPPEGSDLPREFAIRPTGDSWFASEASALSRAYRDMPVLDANAAQLWEDIGQICDRQAEKLRGEYKITVLRDRDPYNTAEEMHADIDKGIYQVTTLHSFHPVWDIETNVNFRIAHDILGHGGCGADFSFKGEVEAYAQQCKGVPEKLWPVLFTEIICQVAYSTIHHLFGEQKVGLVHLDQAQMDSCVGKVLDAPSPDYDDLHQSV